MIAMRILFMHHMGAVLKKTIGILLIQGREPVRFKQVQSENAYQQTEDEFTLQRDIS